MDAIYRKSGQLEQGKGEVLKAVTCKEGPEMCNLQEGPLKRHLSGKVFIIKTFPERCLFKAPSCKLVKGDSVEERLLLFLWHVHLWYFGGLIIPLQFVGMEFSLHCFCDV
jgi:hypothetical protein